MGVFKEEAYVFETIEGKQRRIYTDSADYGYPYDMSDPPEEVTQVIEAVKYLQQLDKEFPEEKGLVRKRETWKNGVSVTIRIAWEKDEAFILGEGYLRGTEYVISFNKTPKHPSLIDKSCNAFISIDSRNYKEKA